MGLAWIGWVCVGFYSKTAWISWPAHTIVPHEGDDCIGLELGTPVESGLP